jgi:Caspase domain
MSPAFVRDGWCAPPGFAEVFSFLEINRNRYTSRDFGSGRFMRKACIAIGVDEVLNTTKLKKLRAAAKGAQQIAEWAEKAGFETICLTDQAGTLAIDQVKKAVKKIAVAGSYSQLILYFAGHGILKSWDTEMWLLSDAATDPNEAVNLVGSISLARNAGIPHILFVSDACRSIAADTRLAQVTGSIIFPIQGVRQRPEIDTFYASLPGDPSYEIAPDEAVSKYDGVFTKCLLDGLAAPEDSVCEKIDADQKSFYVVSSRSLKPWLELTVPKTVGSVSLALNQYPELRVESQPPKYLVRLAERPRSTVTRSVAAFSSEIALKMAAADHGLSANFLKPGELAAKYVAVPRAKSTFNKEMDLLLAATGREAFETHTGFTVHGADVTSAEVDGSEAGRDIFGENGATQIRVHPFRPHQSVLIVFGTGTGTCLAALPGYIGTVVVKDGRVMNVSYTPSRNSPRWLEYQIEKDEVEKRRAFSAVAARNGILKLEKATAGEFALYVRHSKSFDPTLGIYAAYAYAQAGSVEDVESVFDWMWREGVPITFDLALLAGKLDRGESLALSREYAPQTPMLTQGWALLHEGLDVPEWLLQASRYTLPSLWTTLSPEGVKFVGQMLRGDRQS